MYICDSCRGAAVTIMEPGHVGVWQRGPLGGFSFNKFVIVGWDLDICITPF